MSKRNYWLDLFTAATWDDFKAAGSQVSGFRTKRWNTVQKIEVGDYLLCYLTGLSRFIGILEVLSKPYKDNSPIWKDEEFPCRLKVKVVAELTPETAIPVIQLKESLSQFMELKNPHAWTGYFRGSPLKWSAADAEIVINAIKEALNNPVVRPFDERKLKYRPVALRAKMRPLTKGFTGLDFLFNDHF